MSGEPHLTATVFRTFKISSATSMVMSYLDPEYQWLYAANPTPVCFATSLTHSTMSPLCTS